MGNPSDASLEMVKVSQEKSNIESHMLSLWHHRLRKKCLKTKTATSLGGNKVQSKDAGD